MLRGLPNPRLPEAPGIRNRADATATTGRRSDSTAAVSSPYNEHRPHRALGQRPPVRDERPLADVIELDRLRRRDLLGGLIHEYRLAA
jgi:hypothetical protein